MGRFYVAVKDESLDDEDKPGDGALRRAIFGKRSDAKAMAREWNGGKIVRKSSNASVRVDEYIIAPGKPALLAFINELLGGPPAATSKAAKKAPRKGAR